MFFKFRKAVGIFLLVWLLIGSSFLAFVSLAQAEAAVTNLGGGYRSIQQVGATDISILDPGNNTIMTVSQEVMESCRGGDVFTNGNAVTTQQLLCMMQGIMQAKANTDQISGTISSEIKGDQAKEEANVAKQNTLREILAVSFKSSLSAFAKSVAHDTAVWVASGGRGQKPLFITEGWGAYLKNTADVALGDFIDGIGTQFGVDLCQPDFRVKLAIKIGLDYNQPKKTKCSMTKIMDNWQSAIKNASFSLDYQISMRPGENDISFALMMADQRNSYIASTVEAAEKSAETNQLWKDIKNVAGKILTPGTFIANTFRESERKADVGMSTFTNTIADLVEEFLNTLVSQLLKNLQTGFFAQKPGGGSGSSGNLPNLWDTLDQLSSLFNPNSSPVVSGVSGAKERFFNLIEDKFKAGGQYDVLTKLAQCTDEAKNNPSPTDCVIDNKMLEAIKSRVYVKDLPDDIKNRLFAPAVSKTQSLQTNFSYRSILILRKYRVVPVGWEIAAKLIAEDQNSNPRTLNDLINAYEDETSDYYHLIDPYWVLKIPETYCRRIGYGAKNIFKQEQDDSLSREEYCADEQQCLAEDDLGNCKSYGYCQEERRFWRIGKECESQFNTCQTFKSRFNKTESFLFNSLDATDCNTQNVGCRSFATNFNYGSKEWNGDFLEAGALWNFTALPNNQVQTLSVGNDDQWLVKEGEFISQNSRLTLSLVCNRDNCEKSIKGCNWNETGKTCSLYSAIAENNICSTAPSGISCYINTCWDPIITSLITNPSFESSESAGAGNSTVWTDELAYLDDNNRHYRDDGDAKTDDHSLKLVAANNSGHLITSLSNLTLEKNTKYKVKLSAKGIISSGSVVIGMYAKQSVYSLSSDIAILGGISPLTASISNWRDLEFVFDSGDYDKAELAIITTISSITDFNLDDFEIRKMSADCGAGSVKLYSPLTNITASGASNKFFDRDAESCSPTAEGCSQYIRTKGGLGNNLIYNGAFEDSLAGWEFLTIPPTLSGVYGGAIFGYDSQDYGNYKQLSIEGSKFYALSFEAAQISTSGSAAAKLEMAFIEKAADYGDSSKHLPVQSTEINCALTADNTLTLAGQPKDQNYQKFTCYFRVPEQANIMIFKPFAADSGTSVLLNKMQLEKVNFPNTSPSVYSSYNPNRKSADQLAYIKKAPDYYGCYLYSDGKWPDTETELKSVLSSQAPECSAFAGVCTKKEVGCELYKPVNGDPDITGIVTDFDLCPQECVGYSIYKQEATNFLTSSFRQFIADKKANYCSASYAGCDEFTNLDELGRGAEAKEYYVNFKACQKPSIDDASYYTWEGSDITGYQLKSFIFKKSNIDSAPCTNLEYYDATGAGNRNGAVIAGVAGQNYCDDASDTSAVCSPLDMVSNSDCRELYDISGNISYRLLSKTVSVSENCHPYRRTRTQNNLLQTQTDCASSHGYFNANSECIYMAIPGEGQTCPATAKGCRAYTGNKGNNIRKVIETSNFNIGTTTDILWVDGSGNKNGLFISSEATFPGGNSLSNQGANKVIKHQVTLRKNKTYTLSFWAKGGNSFFMDSIKFGGSPSASDYFSSSKVAGDSLITSRTAITNEWRYYELGPVFVAWDPGEFDYLEFNLPSGVKIYLDNITLKEITDNIYVIENSWFTPLSCDNKLDDPDGKKGIAADTCQDTAAGRCSVGEQLGCAAYTDRFKKNWYIKSFDSLCRPGAVGCEALIDTKNSDSPYSQVFNDGTDESGIDVDKVTITGDELVYLVNDQRTSCQAADKGCRSVGLPLVNAYDRIYGYQTLFVKDNPNRYATDLCKYKELWCEEFATNNSLAYFKEPHGKVCEYKEAANKSGWFERGTETPCVTTYNQTYGTGYEYWNEKLQPLGKVNNIVIDKDTNNDKIEDDYSGWVGACPAAQSTCNEFIDPLTNVYTPVEPTTVVLPNITYTLRPYTLYSINSASISAVVLDTNNCWSYRKDNLGLWYFVPKSDTANFCTVTFAGADNNTTLTRTGVYYALKDTIDYSSCNGLVDFRDSCVLFDDRSQINYATASPSFAGRFNYLTYNAVATYARNMPTDGSQQTAVSPVVEKINPDTSRIIKAEPDRQCAKWLYCSSYEKKNPNDVTQNYTDQDTCLSLASCSYTDDKGRCLVFEDYKPNAEPQYFNKYSNSDANKTGYANVGLKNEAASVLVDGYLPYHEMEQLGDSAFLANGGFENPFPGSLQPIGWSSVDWPDGTDTTDFNNIKQPAGWVNYKFATSFNPKNAFEGTSYVVVNTFYEAKSEKISVEPNSDYYLSFAVNTLSLENPSDIAEALFMISYDNGNNWQILDQVKAGSPWVKITKKITTPSDSRQILLKLKNCDKIDGGACNSGGCNDYNSNTTCDLSGFSLFDDVLVKPVLNVNGSNNNVARTCRIFPAQDAKACSYTKDNNFYYGLYGYCLLADPANNQQCLQWLPLDSLKGEMSNEVSGYFDRAPLYYCTEKGTIKVDIANLGGGINVNSQQAQNSDEYSGFVSLDSGREVKIKPFNIDKEYLPLFRYPYIKFFNFWGGIAGVGQDGAFCVGFLNALMHPHGVYVSLGGGPCISADKIGALLILPAKMDDKTMTGGSLTLLEYDYERFKGDFGGIQGLLTSITAVITGFINEFISVIGLPDLMDLIGVNFDYEKDTWGGWGIVQLPISELAESIILLPLPWHVIDEGIFDVIMRALSGLTSGAEIAGVDSGDSKMMLKIITDESSDFGSQLTDPVSDLGGDILGTAFSLNSANAESVYGVTVFGRIGGSFEVEYCKEMVQVVTSAGDNKAWVARVNPGSGYILTDGDSNLGRYNYFDPFDYNRFLSCPDDYQSSDYKPFGSLVQPSNAQDPIDWDSREGKQYKQPLYYEPPRTKAYPAPYQARMGEVHDINALKQIFGKFFAFYQWNGKEQYGEKNKYYYGYYPMVTSDTDPYNWDITTSEKCPENNRNLSDDGLCRVEPRIFAINYRVSGRSTVRLAFNVKADSNQLPITGYSIDWGDGETTSYSGVTLRNRSNKDNPFVVYHSYNFQKILSRCSADPLAPECDQVANLEQDSVDMTARITVRDNWNAATTSAISFRVEPLLESSPETSLGGSEGTETGACNSMSGEAKNQCLCENNQLVPGVHQCYRGEQCCSSSCRWLTASGNDSFGRTCVIGACQGNGVYYGVPGGTAHIANTPDDGCCDASENWETDMSCPLRYDDDFSLQWIGNAGGLLGGGGNFLSLNNGDWTDVGRECDDSGELINSENKSTEDSTEPDHCINAGLNANRFAVDTWETFSLNGGSGNYLSGNANTKVFGSTSESCGESHDGNWELQDGSFDGEGGVRFVGSAKMRSSDIFTGCDDIGNVENFFFYKDPATAGGNLFNGQTIRRGDVINIIASNNDVVGNSDFNLIKNNLRWLKVTNSFERSVIVRTSNINGDLRGKFRLCDSERNCSAGSNVYDTAGLPGYCRPYNQ